MRCRVLGKYSNAVGRPIGGAKIEIRPSGGAVTATAVQSGEPVTIETTADGVFIAFLAPGEYRFLFPNKQSYTVTVPYQARARFEELAGLVKGGDNG